MNEHGDVIADYAAALAAWESAVAAPAALRLLAARDAVAFAFERHAAPSADAVVAVAALDRQLRATLPAAHRVAAAELADWRESRLPPASAWWWPPTPAGETTRDLLWTLVTTLVIAGAVALTADVARRFLGPGLDFPGAFVTVVLIILVLFAANALTQRGRRAMGRVVSVFGVDADVADDLLKLIQRGVDRALPRLGVRRGGEQGARLALALAALLLIFGISRLLPLLADYYNNRGVAQQRSGALTSARASYQRAISLRPDAAAPHYNLATAHEDSLDWDAAIQEYGLAVQADARLYAAYNNLARLYLLRQDDPASALLLLGRAFAQQPAEAATQYTLYKNRGWAQLRLQLTGLAAADLHRALAFQPDGAGAHCLLAQTLEAQGDAAAALPHWESCVAYGDAENVEAEFLAQARERLTGGSAP